MIEWPSSGDIAGGERHGRHRVHSRPGPNMGLRRAVFSVRVRPKTVTTDSPYVRRRKARLCWKRAVKGEGGAIERASEARGGDEPGSGQWSPGVSIARKGKWQAT